MPRLFATRIGAPLLIIAVAGCATPPLKPVTVQVPALGEVDERFTPGAAVLAGIEPLAASPGISPGDHILLGMVIRRSGVEQTRFIDIRVNDPIVVLEPVHFDVGAKGAPRRGFTSARIAADVRLLDADGRVLKQDQGGFASDFLAIGLMDLSRVLANAYDLAASLPPGATKPPTLPPEERYAYERGFATFLAFSSAVNNNSRGIFRSIMMDFIGYRGLLAAILSRSFSISTDGKPAAGAIRLPGIDGDLPACTVPLSAAFGDTTVVRCLVTAVRPVSPLTLTGGIVRVDITRPSAPDDRIAVQLLAARRGRP